MPSTYADALNCSKTVTWPSCGNEHAKLLPRLGDRSDYTCSCCGQFSVTGTDETLFDLGTNDIKQAQIITDGAGRRWLRPSEMI